MEVAGNKICVDELVRPVALCLDRVCHYLGERTRRIPEPRICLFIGRTRGIACPTGGRHDSYILLAGSFGLVRSLSSALGEEIGWRGFLVPELSKNMSFTATALLSGIVWSLWHYPILIFADYNAGTPTWYGLSCFTVMVIAISFVFAWMRLKSGSLWTGALLHASHNLYVQAIFTPLTKDTGKTAWYIDEFGAVLPIVAVAFAIYLPAQGRKAA
jgi:membrane protease YdiL (CAAX protease family)